MQGCPVPDLRYVLLRYRQLSGLNLRTGGDNRLRQRVGGIRPGHLEVDPGKLHRRGARGLVEPERRGEVTEGPAPPRRDVGLLDTGEPFEESQDGGVVETPGG